MAYYRYKALSEGTRRQGLLQAASVSEAAQELRDQGMLILSLDETTPGDSRGLSTSGRSALDRVKSMLIRKGDVETVLGQLSALLAAGVPVLTALNALADQAPRQLGTVLRAIAERVRGGSALSKSARAEAPFLGETTLGLVAAGEANGTVAEMLREAADLMGRVREVKSQIVQAFAYPALVSLGAIGVATYMVRVVFPKVLKFIQGQRGGVDLPAVSQALIGVSQFMVQYGAYALLAPAGLLVVYGLVRRPDRGSRALGPAFPGFSLSG